MDIKREVDILVNHDNIVKSIENKIDKRFDDLVNLAHDRYVECGWKNMDGVIDAVFDVMCQLQPDKVLTTGQYSVWVSHVLLQINKYEEAKKR